MDTHRRASSPGVSFVGGLLVGTALLLITGCASLRSPSDTDREPRATVLAPRPLATSFTAAGRVAARVTGDNTRGFSGGFSWTRRPGGDTIELLSPLGQVAARMSVSESGAVIELSDGTRTNTADPEGFLSESFGVALPIAALPHWFQGVPLPGTSYRAEADSLGRPVTIWQNGWQIEYSDYASDTVTAQPRRLHLIQGDVDARMIISEWSAR
jgi:outer membrane lipoprotein LolB